jgi:hypothetical protein
VRVAQIVMDHWAYGWSVDEMCRQHPYLKPAEVHSAMGYNYDHAEEIDAEIRAEVEQVEQPRSAATASRFYLRMHAKAVL